MKITLKYFASIREALGTGSEGFEGAVSSVAELRLALVARGGAYTQVLAQGRAVRVAVNQVLGHDDTALVDGAEVAFFPPVTGG